MRRPIFVMIACAALLLAWPAMGASKKEWQACESGDWDVRVAACSGILNNPKATKKNRVDALYIRAYGWERKREFDRAIADYTEALRFDPENVDIYIGRASVWARMLKADHALADLNKALSINPKDAHAYLNRSIVWRMKGDDARADDDFSLAIKLDPKYVGKK